MRLDAFLVAQGKADSRSRARRAITMGNVKVDGSIVTKPSKQVGYSSKIEVTENINVSAGYIKLKEIQESTGLILPGDAVLDLGSSAGGFMLFASETANQVRGIEYSTEFMPMLNEIAAAQKNISIIQGDVFTMSLMEISESPVDVILNDLTVEPDISIKILEKVLPLLKPGGSVLQVLKLRSRSGLDDLIDRIRSLGLQVRHIIEAKKREVYVVAVQSEHNKAVV